MNNDLFFSNNPMPTIYLAVRLKSSSLVNKAVHWRGRGEFIDSRVERKSTTLKNVAWRLHSRQENALAELVDDCRLYWIAARSAIDLDQWLSFNEVELVLAETELTQFDRSIRGYAGARYIDACDAFADQIVVTKSQQRTIFHDRKGDTVSAAPVSLALAV